MHFSWQFIASIDWQYNGFGDGWARQQHNGGKHQNKTGSNGLSQSSFYRDQGGLEDGSTGGRLFNQSKNNFKGGWDGDGGGWDGEGGRGSFGNLKQSSGSQFGRNTNDRVSSIYHIIQCYLIYYRIWGEKRVIMHTDKGKAEDSFG